MDTLKIGEVSIDCVVEIETIGGTSFLFPDANRDAVTPIDWLRPKFANAEGRLAMCIQTYVLRTPEQTILIDTCVGNDKQRPVPLWHERSGSFLADLAALGVTRESVDLVICTHLHVDHVGWNTVLAEAHWVPTFPNARYQFGRVEWDYWSQNDEHGFGSVIEDSVRPIVDAGLADLFEMDQRLTNEIRAEPTPGHSPGHTSLWIESAGERALVTGDFLHHPCQAARVNWCSTADHDRQQAIETRHRMFKMLAAEQVPILGMHFAGLGLVKRDGDAYRIDPMEQIC